jgi:RNA dependent RNA polymerase
MGDRTLTCTSISCGLWDYIQLGLVFKPYFTLTEPAKMTFKSKSIVFKTDSDQRLDISYYTIEAVAYESLPIPAMTITLREAPRFCESPCRALSMQEDDSFGMMASLLEDLFLSSRGPNWNRLPGLNMDHKKIAGSCLVYRILLKNGAKVDSQTKSFSGFRGMPRWTRRHINIYEPQESYVVDFELLLLQLAPTATPLPFAIRFHLQKLAQNGYLPPSKVVQLLPEIKRIFSRSGQRVGVDVIRKLLLQLPFAGPDAKAKYFNLQNLENLLQKNEEISNREGSYFEVTGEPERVAVIHKATVTPAGIYLHGPYLESNNRVLRKYPNHHDCFLRVQFCDEDGLQVYSNRDVSSKPVFDKFRKVLNNGFHIAGQHFNFLGFSHSSLRAQSCWFMAPFVHNGSLLYDREVIKDLGNFSNIRSPARCAARIGQAFSDTRDAIALDPEIVKEMPDVERNGRVFSDGVGTISMEALEQIWDGLLHGKKKPTVLQIRYQGRRLVSTAPRVLCTLIYLRSLFNTFTGRASCILFLGFLCVLLDMFPCIFACENIHPITCYIWFSANMPSRSKRNDSTRQSSQGQVNVLTSINDQISGIQLSRPRNM